MGENKNSQDPPVKPEKDLPGKPDPNPDPTRIEEPQKTDPTRIDEPKPPDPIPQPGKK